MDIHIDWATSSAIIGSLATVLTFVYGVWKKPGKKEEYDDIDEDTNIHKSINESIKELEMDKEKTSFRLDTLEKNSASSVTKEELDTLKDDFLEQLSRIEKRLEKMLDIIINLNSQKK